MVIDSPEKFVEYANKLQNKKHPLLPKKISIQLVNKDGGKLKIENILCHLNIFIDSMSYYTYSFIPTNSDGIVIITKEQIIKNTELKHYFDESLKLDYTPVKFEFMVMDNKVLNIITASMKNFLTTDTKSIKEDLKNKGFNDAQIALQIPMIEQKMRSEQQLYDLLIKNKNTELDLSSGEMKITDYWNSESEYEYEYELK